jgi:23S rRNA (adenine2503-C2)-methyltransferase
MSAIKTDLKNLTFAELNQYLISLGEKSYRAKQIFSWLYQKQVSAFEQMSNLPLELRNKLERTARFSELTLIDRISSPADRTQKFLFGLNDSNLIETVFIPGGNRLTVCLSTQIGCRFRCGFCASGKAGFVRNLETSEIINQMHFISRDILPQRISNVVFMGMGEPLDNYDNVIKAIRIINHPFSFNIGARKITISTAGIPKGINKLSKENIQTGLSVSLHAANDSLRTELMPVNRIYPLEKLIPACQQYSSHTNRIITFEYLLLKGINDQKQHIKELIELLRDLRCKINLILYNACEDKKFSAPSIEEALGLQQRLKTAGIITTLRRSQGGDILAACGQLRLKSLKKSAQT